ncbi:MAG: HP0495 family protein [Candidatus Anammoxibacter sp.]
MKIDEKHSELKLEYPCQWVYKVIGANQKLVQEAIDGIVKGKQCRIHHSHNSKTGKYSSFNLELTVESEEERDLIYRMLKNHTDIRMVL